MGDGVALDDAASGVSLVMPHGWHRMVPGDPAWTRIYGEGGSPVEAELRDGSTQDFALPLDTPDARLLSLVIYARSTTVNDVGTLAEQYADVLMRVLYDDYGLATVLAKDPVSLPAGDASRVEATMPYTGSAKPTQDLPTRDDHVVAYVLLREGRSYYLVFRGNEHIFDNHLAEMACMAESLRLTDPSPSASAKR